MSTTLPAEDALVLDMQRPESERTARPRVAVVGDESLAVTCAEIARSAGLEVVVLLSNSDSVLQAATSIDLPVVDFRETNGFVDALHPHDFEILVSAANQRIIPEEALAVAETCINFHDGPLPGYAGLNVTSWAIHNGETEHGVTWHLMTTAVDGGDVIASSRFDVLPDETALSLNARCYEEATALFSSIADALAAGTLTSTPQQEGSTKMYRRRNRPQVFIDPAQLAHATARKCRSLDVGPRVDNAIGSARLVVDGRCILAHDVVSLDDAEDGVVGKTTLGIDGSLRVTCAAGVLAIARLSKPDGSPVEAAEVVGILQSSFDGILPSPPAELVDGLAANDADLATHEPWWARQLRDLDISLPAFLAEVQTDELSDLVVPVPDGLSDAAIAAAMLTWLGAVDEAAPAMTVANTDNRAKLAALRPVARPPVLRVDIELESSCGAATELVATALSECYERGPFLEDLVDRSPNLRASSTHPFVHVDFDVRPQEFLPECGTILHLVRTSDGALTLRHHLEAGTAQRVAEQIAGSIEGFTRDSSSVIDVPIIGPTDQRMLDQLNRTTAEYDRAATIDTLLVDAIRLHPDAPAVSAGNRTLSYAELGHAIDNLADRLRQAGIERGDVVGISLNRGIEMVVSMFAVMRSGAAYLPLDPSYPVDRLQFMVDDSDVDVVVATSETAVWLREGLTVVEPAVELTAAPGRPTPQHEADDLAYVIYTSGSTGLPKGVQLEHRNVVNFFVAMDAIIDHDTPGVWMAVTSLSFDISVLELMWTLTRGFHVVVKRESGFGSAAPSASTAPARITRPTTMSLFYFAAGEEQAHEGYRLMLESAKWADERDFEAVWVPERHFHDFGAPYPNPSVVAAALAATTKNIAIRAGSVVLPLHSPIRVAEEWAVVDNLSGGRVGISFAAGWQPNDFVLNPSAYATAKESLPELMTTVQELWRGGSVELPGHDGKPVTVTTLPRPVQAELPSWLTSAGSASTFERAGRLGLNILTHLLGQSIEQLATNIDGYRKAWAEAGHDGDGQITLMLHTFLDEDADAARETARLPLKGYLGTAVGLLKDMASAFPTFANSGANADEAFKSLSEDEIDQLLDMAADRYLVTSGLFGDADDALDMIRRASAAGADEIACLVDFGIDTDAVLDSLTQLEAVHLRVREEQAGVRDAAEPEQDETVAGLVARHGVTHLQCTPSLAAMLIANPTDRESLRELQHIMLGGEALPAALAADIRELGPGRFTNMYGPTETTIWSLTHEVDQSPTGSVPIGTPVANNTVYVLDGDGRRLPVGVFGELHIGGEGVARGYHDRPDLNAERFVDRPGLGRLYATGDVVRVHHAGFVEFGGRADGQVKIRGHRVELGEIESVLDRHPTVSQSVVVARGDTDPMLVAFVTMNTGESALTSDLRAHVAAVLPGPMVPSVVVILDSLPLTPNGKIDRKRLPSNIDSPVDASILDPESAPSNDNEKLVADVWLTELGRPAGRDENFFDIGGHSLLAVKVFRSLADSTGLELALTDVFRYPTIRSFAVYLGDLDAGGGAAKAKVLSSAVAGADRAARRRKRTPR